MNLYLLLTALYISLAALLAADAALASFTIVPWFNGLRWLRVHLITLGAITETLFGLLPMIVAIRAGHRFRFPTFMAPAFPLMLMHTVIASVDADLRLN